VGESTYEVQGDSGPTGRFGRRVVYELPDDTSAAEVMSFLRSNMPEGWTEPDDATCVRLLESHAPPPAVPGGTAITMPEEVVLLSRESQLTVYAPGEDGSGGDDGSIDGFTFTLSRDGDQKLLTLDLVSMSCGVPQPDRQAEEFDNGPRPIQVVPTVPVAPQ
jgi:hypothetical protein